MIESLKSELYDYPVIQLVINHFPRTTTCEFFQPLDRGISSSGRACCEAMETELKEAKRSGRNAKADRTSCGLLEAYLKLKGRRVR